MSEITVKTKSEMFHILITSNSLLSIKKAKANVKRPSRQDILTNMRFVEKLFEMVVKLCYEKTGVQSKLLAKLRDRFAKLNQEHSQIHV